MSATVNRFNPRTNTFAVDDSVNYAGMSAGAGVLRNLHPKQACAGRACLIHNPSINHMNGWPIIWREDKHQVERQCPHGVGHPDLDDLVYHDAIGNTAARVHGCDGCCTPPQEG